MTQRAESSFSQLSTHWSIVQAAHHGSPVQQEEARRLLLSNYEAAIRKYFRLYLRDFDGAEELLNEFAVRVLRGDLRVVAPAKGRFRAYLKTTLYHLVADHFRAKKRAARDVSLHLVAEPAELTAEPTLEDERAFLAVWRLSLLEKAREALTAQQQAGGIPLATVLRLRTEHLDASDDELMKRLAMELGRDVEPGTFRRWLHLARKRFKEALVREVAATLDAPTYEALEDELQVLTFLQPCRKALQCWADRWRS